MALGSQELMDLAKRVYNEYNEELRKAWEKFKKIAERDYDAANGELWLDFVNEAQDKIYKKYKDIYVDIFHEDYVLITVGKEDWLVSYSDGEWEVWNLRTGEVEFIEDKERDGCEC